MSQQQFYQTISSSSVGDIGVLGRITQRQGTTMSQAHKMHVFESPWIDGDNDTTDRALVRGGSEDPSATRTPLNRTHHVKLLEAAKLLDELFPEGVERIEVRFVYSEQSYQKQFLTGKWASSETNSPVSEAGSDEGEAHSLDRQSSMRTRTQEVEPKTSDVWLVGNFRPIRTVVSTR